jgi:hypothetical protein
VRAMSAAVTEGVSSMIQALSERAIAPLHETTGPINAASP